MFRGMMVVIKGVVTSHTLTWCSPWGQDYNLCHPYVPYLFGISSVKPYRIFTQLYGINKEAVSHSHKPFKIRGQRKDLLGLAYVYRSWEHLIICLKKPWYFTMTLPSNNLVADSLTPGDSGIQVVIVDLSVNYLVLRRLSIQDIREFKIHVYA